ncbi:cleavage stimulation factor subunit 2 [Caerostris extrusa]|uniref:Cleavage stimulation factor subunit 2 n=1 Tax=Caerostris extrusa TaxID=172846 RepID=A0AAV4MX47_CAEEX|nr:cleavage stimulation factor subunit 2 [Caerostris extrusa]
MSIANDIIQDRSMRSVLLGNFPIDTSENVIKDLLSEYGPILNLRLFNDGSSGYAFCEYGESEMALRATHSLTNYELKGRLLKIDIAASEKSKEQLIRLQESVGRIGHNEILQAADSSEKAPEEISKAVASLPAEQMFELMKQMKLCIENNPQEARNLLLQNPQLAFALLQAQVIMRIVDPEVAVKILNRKIAPLTNMELEPKPEIEPMEQDMPPVTNSLELPLADQDMRQFSLMDRDMRVDLIGLSDKDMRQISGDIDWRARNTPLSAAEKRLFDPRYRAPVTRVVSGADSRGIPGADSRGISGTDPRGGIPGIGPRGGIPGIDPRGIPGADLRPEPRMTQGSDPRMVQEADPRMMQNGNPRMMTGADSRLMQSGDPRMVKGADTRIMAGADSRALQGTDTRAMNVVDPRGPRVPVSDPRSMQGADPRVSQGDPRITPDPRAISVGDPRGMHGIDPRAMPNPGTGFGPRPNIDPRNIPATSRVDDPRKLTASGVPVSARMAANNRTPAGVLKPDC